MGEGQLLGRLPLESHQSLFPVPAVPEAGPGKEQHSIPWGSSRDSELEGNQAAGLGFPPGLCGQESPFGDSGLVPLEAQTQPQDVGILVPNGRFLPALLEKASRPVWLLPIQEMGPSAGHLVSPCKGEETGSWPRDLPKKWELALFWQKGGKLKGCCGCQQESKDAGCGSSRCQGRAGGHGGRGGQLHWPPPSVRFPLPIS